MAGCFNASLRIAEQRGWGLAIGIFDPDPFDEAPERLYGHAWNVMPDGRIYTSRTPRTPATSWIRCSHEVPRGRHELPHPR
jgi:hypothetical protein